MQLTRRQFLHSSASVALAAGAFPLLAAETKRYRTALIGTGWWGGNILGEAVASGECQIVALCDVDGRQLQATRERLRARSSDAPKEYRDYRELLDREKPDICIIATPDHWHPLQTIAALKAGAHVYVEKPISHTIQEGRAMVNAARQTGKVVQVGTHRRVSPHNVSGRDFIRSGKAGKIGMVRAFVHYGGGPEKPRANSAPPSELDWDLWCGPGPLRPYAGGIHPRGFRSYLDYANGTLGDWGIHWMDQILWILDLKWPQKITSYGGRPIKGPAVLSETHQTSDAPDHQVAIYDFGGMTVSWEHRQFAGNNAEKGESVGCYFYGTEGTFHMGWQKGWTFYPAESRQEPVHQEATLHAPDQQNIKELWADFLDAIKTGRRPVSDIESVYYSTNVSLLGMLSYKLGRGIAWDGKKEAVVRDPEANRMLRRDYREGWEYPAI